ncbi:MAG: biotin-dependent carboxyltransferase family protein [Alphaproteobacteria bacterium]|nr:biotin-dependent carboxyltransferase family protein [Alphaproteobacteria bacterium]
MNALIVVKAGAHSTLQDRGRFGFLRYGVATAGAFDDLYLAIANRLVGNDPGAAAIEMTFTGDTLRVEAERCRVAFAGWFALAIDGEPAMPWQSYTLERGQTITVGDATHGLRGYLAVDGGFDVAPVLGSLAVHTRSRIGPLEGRTLRAGDRLPLKSPSPSPGPERRYDSGALPGAEAAVRVVAGPQDRYFSPADCAAFLAAEHVLTEKCDRMGYQIRGPAIDYRKDIPLISDGIALGSIQVLGGGLAIINLVDRQTTGGYPKIATVIGPDIRVLAQARPGQRLRFAAINIDQAAAVRRTDDARLATIDRDIEAVAAPRAQFETERLLTINLIDGVARD